MANETPTPSQAEEIQALVDRARDMATLNKPGAAEAAARDEEGNDDVGGGPAPAKGSSAGAKAADAKGSGAPPAIKGASTEGAKPPATPAETKGPAQSAIPYEYRGKQFAESDPKRVAAALSFAHDYSEKMAELRATKESPDWKAFHEFRERLDREPHLAEAVRTVLNRSDDRDFLDQLANGRPPSGNRKAERQEEPEDGEPEGALAKSVADLRRREEKRAEREEQLEIRHKAEVIRRALDSQPAFREKPELRRLAARHLSVGVASRELELDAVDAEVARLALALDPGSGEPARDAGPAKPTPHTSESGRGAGVPGERPEKVVLGQNTEAAAERYLQHAVATA